jgi:hypothetical protein
MLDSVEVWERQFGESVKAYQAFAIFRDLGADRSCQEVARRLSKSGTQIYKWSSKWNWYNRARAFDLEQERQNRELWHKERIEMDERQAKISLMLQDKVVKRLINMTEAEIAKTPLAMMIKAFEIAVKIERLARGVATEHVANDYEGEINVRSSMLDYEKILRDPKATELTCQLLDHLAADELEAATQPKTSHLHIVKG